MTCSCWRQACPQDQVRMRRNLWIRLSPRTQCDSLQPISTSARVPFREGLQNSDSTDLPNGQCTVLHLSTATCAVLHDFRKKRKQVLKHNTQKIRLSARGRRQRRHSCGFQCRAEHQYDLPRHALIAKVSRFGNPKRRLCDTARRKSWPSRPSSR